MAETAQATQAQTAPQAQPEAKQNDKELNFRRQQQMYERMLAERDARLAELENAAKIRRPEPVEAPEPDDDEPYPTHKKLEKKLASFEKRLDEKIEKKAEEKAVRMVQKAKQDSWIEQNQDFADVLEKYADTFAERHPQLAKNILAMPDTFERQQLVYNTIKSLGIDKPKSQEPSIQQKIDANKRSPYYQPSGVAAAPYATVGDFSPAGQKNAYEKLQELKKGLRLG